jgi:hypothetical protein
MVSPSPQTTVTLTGALGRILCSCGCDLPVQDLSKSVHCPRCARNWVIRLAITPVRPPGEPVNPHSSQA